MALPSQSARSRNSSYGPRFTVSRRRPRRGRARLLLAILILLGGLGAIYVFQLGGDDPQNTPAAMNTDERSEDTGEASEPENAPVQRPLTAGGNGSDTSRPNRPRDLVMGSPERSPESPAQDPKPRDPLEIDERPTEITRPPAGQPDPTPTRPSGSTSGRAAEVQSLVASAEQMVSQGRVVQARDALNRALHHPRATEADRALMRSKLTDLAAELTFSSKIVPGDDIAFGYTVKSGDLLSTIVPREGLDVEWQLISRINGVSPQRIRPGQTLKLLRGPFHAVISKGAYRLDLYSDFRDSAGNRIYLGSFHVGLGEYDSTPVGSWVVRTNSKLEDPEWVNPRTGERFASGDPENPIGNRWIGIRGTDPNTEQEEGIGIHGTIEPDSIGQQASMGCVRMLKADVELIYDVLTPELSTVIIRP